MDKYTRRFLEEDKGDNQGGGYDMSDWRQKLDGDLQAAPALKDVKDVNSLAKQFVDLQQHIGRSIRIPGEDASPEAKQAFYQDIITKTPDLMVKPNMEDEKAMEAYYKSIGRPEESNAYELPEVEGMELEGDRITFLKSVAHKAGMTKKQFKGMMAEVLEADKNNMVTYKGQIQESRDVLKREWGEAFEGREQAVLTAAKNSNAPDEIVKVIEKGDMRGESLKWLYGLMSATAEGNNFANQHGATRTSPAEAEAEINEIMGDKKGPYWDSAHPAHKNTVDKVINLQRKMSA